jgi:chromosome partitioning protein
MKYIVVTNHKGGSGKTTIAVNLAACWGQGQRALLIDLDDQADASSYLGVEESGEALAAALTGRAALKDAIRTTESGVDLAPAGEALAYMANRLGPDAVRRALAPVLGQYRFVVVDCPPRMQDLVLAGWRGSAEAWAITPVDAPEGLRGASRLRRAWGAAGLDMDRVRLVLTRYDGRRLLDRSLDRQARERFHGAMLQSRVRESVMVRESAAWRRPLVLHAPTHPVTEDLRRLAREVAHG